MDVRQKVGILTGLTILGLASWIHSLTNSENFASWFPGAYDFVVRTSVVTPVIVFFGFFILLLSILRRLIISLVIAVPFTIVLTLLLGS